MFHINFLIRLTNMYKLFELNLNNQRDIPKVVLVMMMMMMRWVWQHFGRHAKKKLMLMNTNES